MKKKYPRDLVGYGSKKVKVKWPGNAKLALQFVLNYEEGAEKLYSSRLIKLQKYFLIRNL